MLGTLEESRNGSVTVEVPVGSLTGVALLNGRGFPGETYEEFQDTLSLIREVGFTSLFTFIYSPQMCIRDRNNIPERKEP